MANIYFLYITLNINWMTVVYKTKYLNSHLSVLRSLVNFAERLGFLSSEWAGV